MKYYTRVISSKHDYRKGFWTCNACSIGVDTSSYDDHRVGCLNYVNFLSKLMGLRSYLLLYKLSPYGFNRVEKFKGLNFQKSKLSLSYCFDFLTSDDGCEYMFACAELGSTITSPNVFDTYQSVIFMGSERSYGKLITSIPMLKSINNIENFLIA